MSMQAVFPTYQRWPFEIVQGQGVHLTDQTGKTYLDFTAWIGVCNFGYQYPAIQNAVSHQLTKIWHTSNLYESQLQEHVAELLAGDADHLVFFANSGTEANEAALKLARKATGRANILAFNHSFHGRTYGAMSMTGNPKIKAGFAPLVPDVQFADYNSASALNQITADLAAVILEIVQGEGGVFAAEESWLQAVQTKCQQQGVLLIIDEVQTGIGRTGTKFAYQAAGLDPDIVTSAKGLANGLPVGAMIGKRALASDFGPGTHGSTFAGNALAMAAAEAVLTALTPAFLQTVQQHATTVWQQLAQAIQPLPAVRTVTGKGLMIGIHLQPTISVQSVIQQLQTHGLLTLSAGDNTLRLLPPLVMTAQDLAWGLEQVATVLETVKES